MKFSFTDKDSYLKWRAEWRENYSALSQQIREGKQGRKMFLRQYRTEGTGTTRTRTLISKQDNPKFAAGAAEKVRGLSGDAWFMLEQLAEAKALSWSMKQEAAKTATPPAQAA